MEGPTQDPHIEGLRNRQIKNLLAINILSLGAPMLVMGDEMRRSQRGNNNPYCQDNEISWLDWSLLEEHGDVHRFVKGLIKLRWMRDAVRTGTHTPLAELALRSGIDFHGVRLGQPDFAHHSHTLAISARNLSGSVLMYFALNMYSEALDFELPKRVKAYGPWRRVIDTMQPAPHDIVGEPGDAQVLDDGYYPVGPQSVLALVAWKG